MIVGGAVIATVSTTVVTRMEVRRTPEGGSKGRRATAGIVRARKNTRNMLIAKDARCSVKNAFAILALFF